jgi:hypothetical protein
MKLVLNLQVAVSLGLRPVDWEWAGLMAVVAQHAMHH